MSLFGANAGTGAMTTPAAARNGNLIEFAAGRCTLSGKTVTSDPRKGRLTFKKEDGMPMIVWQDVKSGVDSDPIIVFPGDAKFVKCNSCPTGRVYYLKFGNGRRDFFWLQSAKADGDAAIVKRFNSLINETPESPERPAASSSTSAAAAAAAAASTASTASSTALEAELADQTPADRARILQSMGAGPAAPAAQPAFTEDALRRVMAGLAASVGRGQDPHADLDDIISPDALLPLLADEAAVARLLPHLPAGAQSVDALRAAIRSPQYHQALASFSAALNSAESAAVFLQLGLDPAVAAQAGGGVDGLIAAVLHQRGGAAAPMDESPDM